MLYMQASIFFCDTNILFALQNVSLCDIVDSCFTRKFCIQSKIEYYQYAKMQDFKDFPISISYVDLSNKGN
jgi:hypothetical protein